MPGTKYPPSVIREAVDQYLAGKAPLREIAAALGVTAPTVSRWVKDARARGVTPAPVPDVAARVAALAPPPAPPSEPRPDLGDGSPAAMIAALSAEYREYLDTARRAKAQNDPKAETAARSAAVKLAQEIRQLRRVASEEGGEALAITKDDVDAARLEVRRRLDEIAYARGETLMWTLDGTPDVTPSVTRDASVTPAEGPRRA